VLADIVNLFGIRKDLSTKKLTYRPDIDGLRAIAVLAVIANHLPEEFLSSGFLGVDVFFVISGFVVTASLLGPGQNTFSNFYANFLSRRVKRLLPALVVSVAITGIIVLLVDPFPRNSILTGISALFGVANITLFNFELDYFSPTSKLNAFTHTWSLGVEEQFYVIFPLIAWFTFLRAKNSSLRVFSTTVILISVVSAVLFLWFYDANQAAAYFLMPARMWELGVGSLVYVYSEKLVSNRFSSVLPHAASGALVALILCFMAPLEYASWIILLAVALTAVLLASSGPSYSSRLLSARPFVYTGKISYSLDLWHWPIVSLAPLVLSANWRLSPLYIAAMAVSAVCSYHMVEKPLRKAQWTKSKVTDIVLGFSFCILLSGAAMLGLTNINSANEEDTFLLYPTRHLPIPYSGLPYSTCVVDDLRPMTPQTFDQCTTQPKPGMPTIWAMGDSHTAHLEGMLYALHSEHGVGVHLVVTPGRGFPASFGVEYPPRKIIYERVSSALRPGDIVLLARLYLHRKNPPVPISDVSRWIKRVQKLAQELKAKGVKLVITTPPPIFQFEDIRECDITNREFCAVKRADIAPYIAEVTAQLNTLKKANSNVIIVDLFDLTCPSGTEYCYPDDGKQFLYWDRDHFNSLGSKRLAKPVAKLLHSSGVLGQK
jgi:peptidoglycan/LPS O-acetylase OafA/YrhL